MKSENSLITELRNDRWIYNPVVYSQLSGDFTLLQQRILVGIIERLQQRILDSVDEQKRTNSFVELFDESEVSSEKAIELNIPADDLGILPSNYAQLQQAAEALGKVQMKYPRFGANGKVSRYVVASLFPRIEMPVYKRRVVGEEVDGKRIGILRVVMLTENIRDIFTMQYGYVKHISHIARIAQKKRTPRLYIYLSRYKDVGHKKVPYKDLIEYLGLTDEYYFQQNYGGDGRKETTVNPYSSWSKVKMMVLDPVQKEMQTLAEKGEINFSFDFMPIFPPGKSRGTPKDVLFTIKPSQMGEARMQQDKRTNAIFSFIDRIVGWRSDISNYSLLKLMADMSDEVLGRFLDFGYNDARKIVERRQPDDVAAYMMGVLRKWKQDNIVHEVEPDLFSPPEEKKEEPQAVPGEYAAEWQRLLAECPPEFRTLLEKAEHKGSFRGFLHVEFPDKESLSAFNALCNDAAKHKDFADALMAVFNGDARGRVLVRGTK